MKTTKQALESMRELLSDETKWTKGESARDANGKAVPSTSEDAASFCLIGAIHQADGAYHDVRNALVAQILKRSERSVVYFNAVVYFNDLPTTTHADILGVLDDAIAAEEG